MLLTCPECQSKWASKRRRSWAEYREHCPPCYKKLSERDQKRQERTDYLRSSRVATRREMAPWLVEHPELYRGPRIRPRSGTPNIPFQRRSGYPLALESP